MDESTHPAVLPPLASLGAALARTTVPWAVAGGWAVDLHLGRVTRPHHDLEVALLRRDLAAVARHLAGWAIELMARGRLRPWDGKPVAPPLHQLRATRGAVTFDLLLNDSDGADWVYRRDPRIRLPLARFVRHGALPHLDPAIVLLFKSKAPRPVDGDDFMALLPTLDAETRTWLAAALGAGHEWTPMLAR